MVLIRAIVISAVAQSFKNPSRWDSRGSLLLFALAAGTPEIEVSGNHYMTTLFADKPDWPLQHWSEVVTQNAVRAANDVLRHWTVLQMLQTHPVLVHSTEKTALCWANYAEGFLRFLLGSHFGPTCSLGGCNLRSGLRGQLAAFRFGCIAPTNAASPAFSRANSVSTRHALSLTASQFQTSSPFSAPLSS